MKKELSQCCGMEKRASISMVKNKMEEWVKDQGININNSKTVDKL